MNEHVNHGGEELAPVIPIFGRRFDKPASPDNAWVSEANPVHATDDEGWWVAPEAPTPPVPLSSAPSAAHADDEAGSRRRHPTSSSITLPEMGRAKKPTLMRASDLAKPADQRRPHAMPEASERQDAQSPGEPMSDDVARRAEFPAAATARSRPRLRVVQSADDEVPEASPEEQREQAETALLKKLRGKGLSISEARSYLRGLGFGDDVQNDVVEACVARRYLDDAVLAEQIVYAGSTRKGQGRRAIAMALSARGIDREIITAAMAGLEDDDDERALEYARSRATALSRLQPDVALRRLLGQLARRGFAGTVAREAAQQALREVSGPRFR
ncbi:hypothetical protein GCM10009860_17940 [Microbacterium mitrae]|uniref:Regulatory protein RecX n=1 Tax=Microbacterium mitrae TaxID=664640 RepID=A0A5C8HNR0_9MICO|nr:regulatory protein RecX [Microbacterium mitrae]TXK04659.1 hypothetical protein FVP60_08290 [Microbacterium mitrae]